MVVSLELQRLAMIVIRWHFWAACHRGSGATVNHWQSSDIPDDGFVQPAFELKECHWGQSVTLDLSVCPFKPIEIELQQWVAVKQCVLMSCFTPPHVKLIWVFRLSQVSESPNVDWIRTCGYRLTNQTTTRRQCYATKKQSTMESCHSTLFSSPYISPERIIQRDVSLRRCPENTLWWAPAGFISFSKVLNSINIMQPSLHSSHRKEQLRTGSILIHQCHYNQ